MKWKAAPDELVAEARARAALTQRELARRARTAQSVVARIELGETSPGWTTLLRLLAGAGFELAVALEPRPTLDRQELDDVARILALTPEERLREVANLSRFLSVAKRA